MPEKKKENEYEEEKNLVLCKQAQSWDNSKCKRVCTKVWPFTFRKW